ncbi:AAA family ATPase [Nocardia sp. NPDC058658]|uniref:MinD/ParA family ATP-binding protein n=1 Tax=Nocardia sp. NPDC058658 TaxID=3346580 RepID=UPI00366751C5
MSRNNDSLPMLPPWLSESDVTQVGYEAPVENLPQDDEIDEAPKRRRFMSRGDDAPRKDKGRRRRKDREADEEATAAPAEPAPQSGWSTPPPASPLIPGPSHQQPRREEPPRPTYEQPGRDHLRSPSREQQARAGWQAAPNPLVPSPSDSAPRPNAQRPSATTGPADDSMPWHTGQPSPTATSPAQGGPSAHAGPAPTAESPNHADGSLPTRTPAAPSTGFTPLGPTPQRPDLPPPPPLPDPPARPTQAPPRLTAPPQPVVPPREAEQPADTASPPTATPVPAAEAQAAWDPFADGTSSPAPAETPEPHSDSATRDAQPDAARTSHRAAHTAAESMSQDAALDHAVPEVPSRAVQSDPRPVTGEPERPHTAPSPTDHSATEAFSGVGHSGDRSPHATGESAAPHGSPYSSGESVAPQQSADQRSPYASGETVQPSTYPATQYNSVPGDPTPVAPTHAPDGRTEVFRSDDPRLPSHGPEGGSNAPDQARPAQTGYRSGEFVQAADAVSPYPRPDGTPAQHQQPDGLPTYGPDGVAVRPDGAAPRRPDAAPTQHRLPDGAPAQQNPLDGAQASQFAQPNQGAQQQFLPNGPSLPYQPDRAPTQQQPTGPGQQYLPNGTPAQQFLPDGTPAPQHPQPNGPGQQYLPDGTPAPQYHADGTPARQYRQPGQQFLPDGTAAPQHQPNGTFAQQYQQPNAPQFHPDGTPVHQQYQQPTASPQHQQPGNQGQPPYGQPGWGAQQQGYQPSLDDVPVKRAKKAPGSGWRKAVHHVSGGAINPGMSAEELRLQELVARIRQPVRGDYRIAVLSLKGGVGKTTTTTGLGSIFASIRGDRVIAVDANPDFGTLSQRVAIQTRSTVRDLLLDPSIQRYSDVRRHTSQGSSRLEVLASERDPAASEAFNDEEYRAVARILQRFYNIILTDCGTGLMHSAMSGVLDLAHSLVLISSAAIDGARSAAATLDWLSLHGHDHLVRNAVVVINLPREGSPNVGVQQLRQYFLSRCRAVHIIPFDEHLSEGAEIDLHRLHKSTKRAYVELAATVADEFGVQHHRLG